MSDLPTDVVVQYGSYIFPVETDIVGIDARPVWDSAGRTITSITYSLTVQTYISVDPSQVAAGMDATFDSIRTQLLRAGDNLIIKNSGAGNFDVNPLGHGGNGPDSDLIWGPKPEIVSWKGEGYKYAAKVTWKVSFSLDACGGSHKGKVLEWNYKMSFAEDQSGYTRRTYSGHVAIPMTRKAPTDRTLVDQVDRLREQITPSIPIGFRRPDRQFDLSEDKRRLDFNIVDEQCPPNVPPPNVVIAEAGHTADSMDRALVRFNHTLRGSYELPSTRARVEAWTHFRALFQDRIDAAKKNGMTVIPVHLHVGEPEIYGRKAAEFALHYWMLDAGEEKKVRAKSGYKARVTDIIGKGGLWRPAAESDWEKWNKSMADAKVNTPRGTAGLVFKASDDALVDLCLGGQPIAPKERALTPRASPGTRVSPWQVDRPDEADSFLDYELVLDVQPIDNTIVLQPLPVTAVQYSPQQKGFEDQTGFQQPYRKAPCAITQYRGAPLYVVTLWGRALRAGYDVTPPVLVNVGGQQPLPYNDAACGFRSWVAANLGLPIVAAQWRFRYVLPCPPSSPFTAPPHPIFGSTSKAAQEDGLSGFIAAG